MYQHGEDQEITVDNFVFVRVPEEGIDLYAIKEMRMLRLGDTLVALFKTDEYFDEEKASKASIKLDKNKSDVKDANALKSQLHMDMNASRGGKKKKKVLQLKFLK